MRPVDGLTATSSNPPVSSVRLNCLSVIFVPSATTANRPSVADPVPVERFNLATPTGKSVVVTEVTGYRYMLLFVGCSTSSSDPPSGVYS